MITYSVTVTINSAITDAWLSYMKTQHIAEVMSTGCFISYVFQELIVPEPESGTRTFNIQYFCESLNVLKQYQEQFAPALQAEHTLKFQDQFVAFRTVLQKV
jgi:hypothetical protein